MKFFKCDEQLLKAAKEESRGRGHIWIIELLIFAAVFLVTAVISALAQIALIMPAASKAGGTVLGWLIGNGGTSAVLLISLFTTAVVTVGCIIFCRYVEGRPLRGMGFVKKDALKKYGTGLLIGLAMFAAAVLLGTLCGAYRFEGMAKGAAGGLALYFLGFLIQGMSEEVMCRGYLMMSLTRRSPILAGVLLNSVVFGLLHLGNNGFSLLPAVNLLMFGIFMSVYMLRTGDIWGASAIHSIWNFAQGNIFGLSVSGMPALPSIFDFGLSGSKLVNGGAFGPEGGLAVTVVLALSICAVCFLKTEDKTNVCS